MKSSSRILLALAFVAMGCGASEEAERVETTIQPPTQSQPPVVQFETTTDTVKTTGESERAPLAKLDKESHVRFMVQLGAFRDPHYASQVQTKARERYHLPVLNDYDIRLRYYQIRIGFFETREQAAAFQQRMRREFPRDYNDSWVVQLKR